MDIQRFVAHLTSLDKATPPNHKERSTPDSLSMPSASPQVKTMLKPSHGMTTAPVAQLLSTAIGFMAPGEVYCEVGCLPGENLLTVLRDHPDCMAYAVEEDQFGSKHEAIAQLTEQLVSAGMDGQVFLCNQSFEAFFHDLRELETEDRIGVYFYNGKQDYRSVILGLMLAAPFLAEQAVIVINQRHLRTVRQAAWDFLASYPQATLQLDGVAQAADLAEGTHAFLVLSWEAGKQADAASGDWHTQRDRAVMDAIYRLPVYPKVHLETLRKEAVDLHVKGQLSEAEEKYRTILQFDPQNAEIWLNLGMLYYLAENDAAVVEAVQQSLALSPHTALAHYIHGLALERMTLIDEAIAAFQQAIALDETHVETLNHLGNLLLQKGTFKQAEACFQQAIALQPKDFTGHLGLGQALMAQQQAIAAIAAYHQALKLKQRDPEILWKLGEAYASANDFATAHNFFAYSYNRDGNPEAAIEEFQAFLATGQAGNVQDYLTLADCYQLCGQMEAAIDCLQTAASLKPDDLCLAALPQLLLPLLYQSREEMAAYQQRFEQGLRSLFYQVESAEAQQTSVDFSNISCVRLFYLACQAINVREPQALYGQLLQRAMREYQPAWMQPKRMPPACKSGKIRIGYLADSIGTNSMSLWTFGWLKKHDRSQFEIYCYNTGSAIDRRTEQFKALSDVYHYIPNDLDGVCQQILADDLHILVFLAIGVHVPTAMAGCFRLAPVQCAAWGHPVTSGLPTIDYFLSGELMEPEKAQEHYTEQLIRLPNLGISYPHPSIPAPTKTRMAFGLRAAAVVYVSCQLIIKYLPQHDYLFVEIARRVPQAQFVFIVRSTMTNRSSTTLERQFRERLQRSFAAAGLNSEDYCVFLPGQNWQAYTSLLLDADVFLDTPGFSGGHTTFDAIACNLPVVTHAGEFMRGRQSSGMLTMLGVPETIAQTEAEYIDIAARLGVEPEWKRSIAQRMSERHTFLFDDTNCVRGLEQFYQKVVADRLAQQSAHTFAMSSEESQSIAKKLILHVGCGPYDPGALPEPLRTPEWQEIRLDINPDIEPDIIGSITDMSAVPDESVDAVFSSHNLEHLYAHEVPLALAEFYRVLKPGGFVLITLPDIQAVAEYVAQGKLEEVLYVSPAGPIAAIDILYGLRTAIADGNHFMAHRTAFTAESLQEKLQQAGFRKIESHKDQLNLWQRGYK
ncbi:MAG: tetratricopeptide repeat protein [Leptolyngbya sp. BL-A-14]